MVDEASALRKEMLALHVGLNDLGKQVIRLTTLIETEAERCPYREKIADIEDNAKRIGEVEGRQRVIELRMAAISGVSGGGVAAAVMFIGKALGWV